MRIQLRMQINERKAVCEVSRITLNYAAAQLVNIDSICENILGADAGGLITVSYDKNLKRKMRMCDGSGLTGADIVTIDSDPEE